jgi:hypothetical protein
MVYIILLAVVVYLTSVGFSKLADLHKLREPYTLNYKNEQQQYNTIATRLQWTAIFLVVAEFALQ